MDMLNLKIILAWWGTVLRQARSAGTLPPAIMRLMAAAGGAAT